MRQLNKFKDTERGMIPEEWDILTIAEIAKVVNGGTPSTKDPDNFGGDILWITPKDLSNYSYRYIEKGERNITQRGLQNSSAKLLPKRTVLLTTRAPVGYVAIAANEVSTNQGLKGLIPKENILPEFLYYLLKLNTKYLKAHSSGSTFGELNTKTLKSLKFTIPPFKEQQIITYFLSILDKKIELNHQMSKILEQISQAIFKSWFIDFEPVQDGEFVESELGKIPKGWKVIQLEKIIEFIKGKKPKKVVQKQLNSKYYLQILISTFEGGFNGYASIENLIVSDILDPIMVMDGASSGRVEIGYKGIIGSTLAKIRLNSEYATNVYLYCFLKQKENIINRNTTGTSIPHADKKLIKGFHIVLPPIDIMLQFSEIAENFFHKIIINRKENIILAKLRDLLLPQLLSGRLRIKNPENIMEEIENQDN